MAEQPEKSSQVDASAEASPLSAPALADQIEYVRGLAQVVAEEGLSELEIESDGFKLTLKAPSAAIAPVAGVPVAPLSLPAVGVSTAPAPRAASAPKSSSPQAKSSEKFTPVVSPMVGVFYRAPSPSDPNFVEVGDRVERGQTIGLIEAMKVFNEITAESSGVVAEIPVQSGALVETGQPLLLLK